ncbi:MAG TPA: hypothetical protein VHC90_20020 [Bryobacteraceae bacterium]|nr:hypothetical protein [Bryobacteraceae bacterium]
MQDKFDVLGRALAALDQAQQAKAAAEAAVNAAADDLIAAVQAAKIPQ